MAKIGQLIADRGIRQLLADRPIRQLIAAGLSTRAARFLLGKVQTKNQQADAKRELGGLGLQDLTPRAFQQKIAGRKDIGKQFLRSLGYAPEYKAEDYASFLENKRKAEMVGVSGGQGTMPTVPGGVPGAGGQQVGPGQWQDPLQLASAITPQNISGIVPSKQGPVSPAWQQFFVQPQVSAEQTLKQFSDIPQREAFIRSELGRAGAQAQRRAASQFGSRGIGLSGAAMRGRRQIASETSRGITGALQGERQKYLNQLLGAQETDIARQRQARLDAQAAAQQQYENSWQQWLEKYGYTRPNVPPPEEDK